MKKTKTAHSTGNKKQTRTTCANMYTYVVTTQHGKLHPEPSHAFFLDAAAATAAKTSLQVSAQERCKP